MPVTTRDSQTPICKLGRYLAIINCRFVAGTACLVVLMRCAMTGAQQLRPRVLAIGVDGVRPDALAVAKTPNFDRLIREGAYLIDIWWTTQ